MDWVNAIGYRHEILHTAVLEHLLRGDRRGDLLNAFLGAAATTTDGLKPRREARLLGQRPVDLAVEADGATVLAVEVKVDSAWSQEQLDATVPTDVPGVLLAVGLTVLAATPQELAPHWRLIGPARWSELVEGAAEGDADLARYASQVRAEAQAQEEAIRRVKVGEPVEGGRDARLLAHWAYFHEVVEETHKIPAVEPHWARKTLISGPLLTRWLYQAGTDTEGAYLEFMGEGSKRFLKAKCWATAEGALAALQPRLSEALEEFGGGSARLPSSHANTCTARSWDLEGRLPSDAALLAERLAEQLEAIWHS